MVATLVALALCAALSPARVHAEPGGEADGDGVHLVQTQMVADNEEVPSPGEGGLLKKSHDHHRLKKSHDNHRKPHRSQHAHSQIRKKHSKKRRAPKGKRPKGKGISVELFFADNELAGKAVQADTDAQVAQHHGRHSKQLPESPDRLFSCCDGSSTYSSYWQDYLTNCTSTTCSATNCVDSDDCDCCIKPYCTANFYNDNCVCDVPGDTSCIQSDRSYLCEVCRECYSEGCPKLSSTRERIGTAVSGSTQFGGTLQLLSCCDRGSLTSGSDKLWRQWLTRADPDTGDRANYCGDTFYNANCLVDDIDDGVANICHVCTTCFDEGCPRWAADQGRIVDIRG